MVRGCSPPLRACSVSAQEGRKRKKDSLRLYTLFPHQFTVIFPFLGNCSVKKIVINEITVPESVVSKSHPQMETRDTHHCPTPHSSHN